MAMQRMDIESVVVGGGPVASLLVLRTRARRRGEKTLQLPIRIGNVEASAISLGVDARPGKRPLTHDLLTQAVQRLGARCVSARIVGVEGTTFFAQVELERADGEHVYLDARPSDAVALAVRAQVPIFAADGVLACAALPDFSGVEEAEKAHELEEFHSFVENLSPGDFAAD